MNLGAVAVPREFSGDLVIGTDLCNGCNNAACIGVRLVFVTRTENVVWVSLIPIYFDKRLKKF